MEELRAQRVPASMKENPAGLLTLRLPLCVVRETDDSLGTESARRVAGASRPSRVLELPCQGTRMKRGSAKGVSYSARMPRFGRRKSF
jgi:hypothetical protein